MRIPSVEIQFGGVPRLLIFDYEARACLQDIAGTYESGVAHLKAVRAAAYSLLRSETLDKRGRETSRTLSIVEVGNVIDEMNEDEQIELLQNIQKAMGISEPDETDPLPANP